VPARGRARRSASERLIRSDPICPFSVTLMTSRPRYKAMLRLATNPIWDLGRSPTASLGTSIYLQPRSRTQNAMLPKRVGSFLSFMAMSTKLVRNLSARISYGCSSDHDHLIIRVDGAWSSYLCDADSASFAPLRGCKIS
jgi:hypothetical protein